MINTETIIKLQIEARNEKSIANKELKISAIRNGLTNEQIENERSINIEVFQAKMDLLEKLGKIL